MRVYKKYLRWTNEFVKKNIGIIEKNYSLYPHRNKWNCNVHTVHDYEENSVYKIDYKFLRKQYENIATDVIKKYDINDYYLSDIWYNYYKEGQFQEPHVHDGNGGLTAVHYLIFDHKYHSPTLFTDSTIRPLRVRCGDIVFFPNDVEHYVPENQTDKPRLTIAFTVTKVH